MTSQWEGVTIATTWLSCLRLELMSTDEITLLQQIAQRDPDALMVLYDRYGTLVYSLALRVLRQPTQAEEITQDVFVKVWQRPDRWTPTLGRFSSWLLAVTQNAAIDRLRREKRRPILVDDGIAEIIPADQVTIPGQGLWYDGQLLRNLMERLPVEQAQLIELAFFQGYTHSELADLLDLPLGTVKTRLRSGLQKLRVLWEQTTGEPTHRQEIH